jgi:hypothetical protein
MDESEQKEILERYRKALESIRHRDPGLPDVPVFRGTMLVKADGTEYHYDDEWCRAEDMRAMGARLKRYLDVARPIETFSGDEIGGDLSLYVRLEDVAALLADADHITHG